MNRLHQFPTLQSVFVSTNFEQKRSKLSCREDSKLQQRGYSYGPYGQNIVEQSQGHLEPICREDPSEPSGSRYGNMVYNSRKPSDTNFPVTHLP